MASNNGHESAFSVAEVIGISAAAAAALGGVIIALGRTQANSSKHHMPALQALPGRREISKQAGKGKLFARDAADATASRYPDARDYALERMDWTADAARTYGAEISALAETGLDKAKEQGKALSEILQDSFVPMVVDSATRARKNVSKQAKNTDTDELIKKSRHFADEAADQLRHAGETVARTVQKDVIPAVAPVMKDVSEFAEDLFDQAKDRAGDARKSKDRFPGSKTVSSGKDSAQHALHTSSQAATDTLATLVWLTISSALIYLVLLSPERRERVKSAAFDAIEQIRLLIGDFKGYETEF
jgi:hypothetical protein